MILQNNLCMLSVNFLFHQLIKNCFIQVERSNIDGATTFSIMTHSIMDVNYDPKHLRYPAIALNAITMSVVMLSVVFSCFYAECYAGCSVDILNSF